MYDADGRFCVIITRSDLPKFASNNRETGTAEENKAIVQGSLAYFGAYSVSEPDKTITSHVESKLCGVVNFVTTLIRGYPADDHLKLD